MKSLRVSFCLSLISFVAAAQTDYTKYVNPFIGTGGHGHTFPGATTPFGMVQLSPDTRIDGSWDGCGGYHYSDSIIYGFSHTHLSGTGVSDYGDIMLMPMMGEPSFDNKIYSSVFNHKNETAGAGFYSVKLLDDDIDVELTATARVGLHKYLFNKDGKANIILDLTHRDKLLKDEIKIIDDKTVEVFRESEGWAKDQWVFARIIFSMPFELAKEEKNEKVAFQFMMNKGESIFIKVSLSAVDYDGAKKNMDAELPGWDFEKIKSNAKAEWNKELSKIEVKGGTEERMKIFYTALYHCMIQPNIYNDVDHRYRGRDNQIHTAENFDYYTVFSLWDTFRAWHPLMTMIDRKRSLDYIKTFLAQYEQGGLLPVWELSSNETECMIGYHSVSVIADAVEKGITDFNLEKVFEAMKKSAESANRFGLGAYMTKGFLETDDEHESVSKMLEYCYDDWCIAQVAKQLYHEDDYKRYMTRSQGWKNLFDPEIKFIRPRKNGGWYEPFDPREVNNNYTEANAWQYNFFVPQDIPGLIMMTGGSDMFDIKLDELFSSTTETTGREQSDITGLIGQYAHGNEPSHHMAFLYNYIYKPWKTEQLTHKILTEFYKNSPDGLIGNEDCGQMSVWYVLASMGLYSVTPGNPEFTLSAPFFSEIKINLENGKRFIINAENISLNNYYVSQRKLNGNIFTESVLPYSNLMEGGNLSVTMTYAPEYSRFVLPDSADKILVVTKNNIVTAPLIISANNIFRDVATISLEHPEKNIGIYFTIDGFDPDLSSKEYSQSFTINKSTKIKAIAYSGDGKKSSIVSAYFYKIPHPDWKIKILTTYEPQYSAGGNDALIDGIAGDVDWRKGNWQGYRKNFECVIDLGRTENISKLSASFLQDTRAWVLLPKQIEFSFSADSVRFSESKILKHSVADNDYNPQVHFFVSDFPKQKVRYVKFKAVNYGKLAEWHLGVGGDAWIFVDEIMIK
ncbi:MAG: GH92 family glycosyl hydrolase [Bacteroidia bacterium]|nr:GH92 family glycosyl hydrolase [Bacteroidia bacterium]